MFRALFLTLCFVFAMGVPDHFPMGPKGPPPLMIQVENCCAKDLLHHDDMDKDMLKECFHMDMKPHTCDKDICFAMKRGYASSDGTIDKKVLLEALEKEYNDNTVALEAISENCVSGDLSKFGKETTCELKKLRRCIELQVIKSCDNWIESGECKMLKTKIDAIFQKSK